jgi:5-formyltetrahydrofolate cyclo-ligase
LSDRAIERKRLRAARAALPAAVRRAAERAIARHLEHSGLIAPGSSIAGYAALGAEISCDAALRLAEQRHCRLYLPRITHWRKRQMRFVAVTGRWQRNRYGIAEPQGATYATVRSLHVILVPLVGVDARGNRLGMGAGFYDRALSCLLASGWRRPILVGIAHSCQQVAQLRAEPHDVPLDALVTERGMIFFRGETA